MIKVSKKIDFFFIYFTLVLKYLPFFFVLMLIIDDGDVMDVAENDNDINEPTMGEKLASLNIKNDDVALQERETKPPSADSVHVLLKQALHADDRSLLLECLFRQDEKVKSFVKKMLNF